MAFYVDKREILIGGHFFIQMECNHRPGTLLTKDFLDYTVVTCLKMKSGWTGSLDDGFCNLLSTPALSLELHLLL